MRATGWTREVEARELKSIQQLRHSFTGPGSIPFQPDSDGPGPKTKQLPPESHRPTAVQHRAKQAVRPTTRAVRHGDRRLLRRLPLSRRRERRRPRWVPENWTSYCPTLPSSVALCVLLMAITVFLCAIEDEMQVDVEGQKQELEYVERAHVFPGMVRFHESAVWFVPIRRNRCFCRIRLGLDFELLLRFVALGSGDPIIPVLCRYGENASIVPWWSENSLASHLLRFCMRERGYVVTLWEKMNRA